MSTLTGADQTMSMGAFQMHISGKNDGVAVHENACKIRCSDLISVSLNQFLCCGESSFCFTHEFFYDFLHGLYFREVGEGHAG